MARAIFLSCFLSALGCLTSFGVLLWHPSGTLATSQHVLLLTTVAAAVAALLLLWRDVTVPGSYRFAWPVALIMWILVVVTCLHRVPDVFAVRVCKQASLGRIRELADFVAAFPDQPTWHACWELECRLWMAEGECKALATTIAEAGFTRIDHLEYLDRRIATALPGEPELRQIRCETGDANQDEQIQSRLRIALDALATAAVNTRLSALTEWMQGFGRLVARPN